MEIETANGKQDAPYEVEEVLNSKKYGTDPNYKPRYVWEHVFVHVLLQIGWLIGFYMLLFNAKWATVAWVCVRGFLMMESIALGAHRYYGHKSFKATIPLQVGILLFHLMAGQNSMVKWVRDHRLHHKYSDTDADPINAHRGFFFTYAGWIMARRHPLVRQKQREIDITDLREDKLVMFQYKYYIPLYITISMIFPIVVPMYLWNEDFWTSFFVSYCFTYVMNLHMIWTVNSFGHHFGNRPYDGRILATQSAIASLLTAGEGSHNFHHAFPWDCRHAEPGKLGSISTLFLELLNYVGLAYDMKVAPPNVIYGHMKRHGDEFGRRIAAQRAELDRQREKSQAI